MKNKKKLRLPMCWIFQWTVRKTETFAGKVRKLTSKGTNLEQKRCHIFYKLFVIIRHIVFWHDR